MKKNGWSCRLVAVSWVCLFVLGACAQPVVSDGDKGVEAAAPALASEVAYARGAGRISLRIAEGWTYEIQEEADHGTFSIIFWSDEDPAGRMRVSYHETFGVCGTGLEQKEIQIGGYPAWQETMIRRRSGIISTYRTRMAITSCTMKMTAPGGRPMKARSWKC